MKYVPLSDDDMAELDSDREFATWVLEARYADRHLTGRPSDVQVLQTILDGGPYTDSAEAELIALGTSFGDLLCKALDLKWIRYADEYGSDLALRYGKTSVVIFPRDMLVKRVEEGEEPDLQSLFDGVVRQVKRLIRSGDYR